MKKILIVTVITLACAGAGWAQDAVESIQFNAKRLDFPVAEGRGFVILPTQAAADGSRPWVWYAPTFIGHHPDESHSWMAKQLLEAGFAICGIDVGESYGSPAGTTLYNAFYKHVREHYDLDEKPCLLPQSRGGLMLLNWAIENPNKVQCIAGIYTVCNIESYPGVDKACGAYGMSSAELTTQLDVYNPVRRVKALADARIPLLFIHGDSDTVVPIEANAGKLVEECRNFEGDAHLIVVPGKGHEVCPEFFESDAFIAFLLSKGASAPKE